MNNFIGYRKKIKKDELEKKYSWISYEQANEILINFSRGLNELNLCPIIKFEDESPFRFLGIYSRNKKEWLLLYLGTMRDRITIVAIYETLGDKSTEFLEQTQLITIVIEIKSPKKIYELVKRNKTFKLKNSLVIDKEDDEKTAKNLELLGFTLYCWEDVVEIGKERGENINFTNP